MKIIVFDVPASSGGALSILNEFYLEVKENSPKDVEWIFVLSEPFLEETSNIKVLRFPWIKNSWLHRIYFDQFVAPKLVKKYKVDKIFSLQNVTIPRTKMKQVLYVHQPLPFVGYKFTFKENKLFWVYQNIISRKIIASIKKAEKTIVQTNWMKEAIVKQAGVKPNKIDIIPPTINVDIKRYFEPTDQSLRTFFYPASASYYKNHRLIVDAVSGLTKSELVGLNFIFTLNGDEDEHIKELYERVEKENLPIQFIGSISKEQVFDYYTKSILIFPSYIETFGLPLLESRIHKGIILAGKTVFSCEILDGYSNVVYFDTNDSNSLLLVIRKINDINYNYNHEFRSCLVDKKIYEIVLN
ncbi:MAG: glycosyltransferase [Solibacillus sp.]